MGVQGLWDEVKAARETTTWGQLSDSYFRSNKSGARGLRVGIDLSIWIYEAKKTITLQDDDGEEVNAGLNADIRVIFYRTCELLRRGILAVFVADGKGRPAVKRGKKRGNDGQAWNTKVNKLFNMFRLMGMEVRRAPGEAEAELAAMAKRGEIDAVLSDDVDGFLFGVPFLIRTSSVQANTTSAFDSNAKTDSLPSSKRILSIDQALSQPYPPLPETHKETIQTFSTATIRIKTKWTKDDMIFFAMFSGGDYHKGLEGCGSILVKALMQGGYSRKLMEQIRSTVGCEEARAKRLKEWREEVAEVFRTNSAKLFDSKHPKLATTLLKMDNFPDSTIIDSYLFPLVSDPTSPDYIIPTWDTDVNLKQLIPFVSRLFEWGHEQLNAKFRNKVWLGILMRELRRKALEQDGGRSITSLALVKNVVAYSSASTTSFAPSYYVHLDSTTYDSLITPRLPKVDPFPFPDYNALDPIEAERIKEERKKLGRAQTPPKAPETGDFRFYVPVGFLAVDEECRGKVKKWIQGVEREKKRKAGKIDDAEDSDEREANEAKEERDRQRQAQMRQEMLGNLGAKAKGKGKATEKGKGKENTAVPVKKKQKLVESTRPSAIFKILSPASSQDSDIIVVESKAPAPTTSRLRKRSKKATSNLGTSFASSKTSLASTSKKRSSPIALSPATSPSSSFASSSSSRFTKSSRKRSLSFNTSPDTTGDGDHPLSASPRLVKRSRMSSPPAPLDNSVGIGVGERTKSNLEIGSSSFMSEAFEVFSRPHESGTLPWLQELKDAGYLKKKEVETMVLSDSD